MSLQASGVIKPGIVSGLRVSKDHLTIAVPVAVAVAVGTYLLTRYLSSRSDSKGKVNLEVDKDNTKVVHSFDVEDLGKKAIYCRCWRSKKFPYCDGSHTKHNEETGDNVGPLIIKKKDA
ncbi:CDGSH iron-sulfur domain-containing protein 1 isoform X1 [Tachysurus fulvidraco]|uniref:CDGSH iron-sulfur domain-containing protein 1 isoform X1 n=1 Tax=Tachysurus fulvidraco TaxID=1234273 RepID=UPI000F4D5083|nr:CDGSH iron-sulfur domain-containing protein 1 isoform X1 [Tachysurus fulvidraco]